MDMTMHRLCLEIGGMTVDELASKMSASEYMNWLTFYNQKDQEPEPEVQEVDWANADLGAIFGVPK